jgi:hypothetical protein
MVAIASVLSNGVPPDPTPTTAVAHPRTGYSTQCGRWNGFILCTHDGEATVWLSHGQGQLLRGQQQMHVGQLQNHVLMAMIVAPEGMDTTWPERESIVQTWPLWHNGHEKCLCLGHLCRACPRKGCARTTGPQRIGWAVATGMPTSTSPDMIMSLGVHCSTL